MPTLFVLYAFTGHTNVLSALCSVLMIADYNNVLRLRYTLYLLQELLKIGSILSVAV